MKRIIPSSYLPPKKYFNNKHKTFFLYYYRNSFYYFINTFFLLNIFSNNIQRLKSYKNINIKINKRNTKCIQLNEQKFVHKKCWFFNLFI